MYLWETQVVWQFEWINNTDRIALKYEFRGGWWMYNAGGVSAITGLKYVGLGTEMCRTGVKYCQTTV